MTILTWPTFSRAAPGEMQWSLISNTLKFESPVNRAVQTVGRAGALWSCAVTFQNLNEADTAILEAFLVSLEGQANRVSLWNWQRERPRGVGGGSPLVKGAGQTGGSLLVDTAPTSVTNWLLAGDYVGVGSRLHMAVANASTDGSGEATLSLRPTLFDAPADNAPITLIKPTVTMMLAEDSVSWQVQPGQFVTHTLRFVEDPT